MEKTDSAKLKELFDDSWEFTLRESPLFATLCGDHRYNDRLSSVKIEDIERTHQEERKFLERLHQIDREKLSEAEKTNRDIFKMTLEESLEGYGFKNYLMPLNNVAGFHISLPELRNQVPLETVQDYENYLSRLGQIKGYMEDHRALMKKGIQEGYVSARPALSGCEDSIRAQLTKPEKSPFFKPFLSFPKNFSEADQKRLKEAGLRALKESVLAGYEGLLKFFSEEYLPAAREEIGASALPRGKEFYRHQVRVYTAPEYTPEVVHQTGLDEVKRIREDMEEVIRKVEFKGNFQEFIDSLRSDPRFYAETEKGYLNEVSYILKKMDGELPRMFNHLPRMPYGIRPVPSFSAPKAPTAYYMRPAGDGSRAGIYYVNTYDLKSRPLYELETLSLHEAVPGHHLQIALQQELGDLPNFRRFSGFMAYIEGWALYAERLGREMGFYEDPYSFFGHLIYEMWRACRLVVDTGIHYMNWSRDQALSFMMKNTGLTEHNIQAEVDRYIAWPGQALSYKMGELKIRSLRKKAEEELGDRFDIRKFHHVLLEEGAVPLALLEANVEEYIRSSRA